jgi:hypothetical protein
MHHREGSDKGNPEALPEGVSQETAAAADALVEPDPLYDGLTLGHAARKLRASRPLRARVAKILARRPHPDTKAPALRA